MINRPPMPMDLIKSLDNIKKVSQEFKKRENEALKTMFGPYIKQSFLIKMKENINKDNRFKELSFKVYDNLDVSFQRILAGSDNMNFDLCKFIIKAHESNTITLDSSERAILQDDIKYQNALKEQVIDLVALRRFGTYHLSKTSLEGYFPITYIVNTINNYMEYIVNKAIQEKTYKKVKNFEFKLQMFMKMFAKITACVVLIDNQLFEEAFNPLRSLLELLMTYLCLSEYDKDAVRTYTKYVYYNLEYMAKREIPEEVSKSFAANVGNSKVLAVDYLNYGWLDKVLEFCYIPKNERTYKIKDLVEVLNMKYSKTSKTKVGNDLYAIYRRCNPMSHGFTIATDSFNCKVDICKDIASILNYLMDEVEKVIDISYIIHDRKLKPLLNAINDDAEKYMKIINNDTELRDKVNSPYRAIVD